MLMIILFLLRMVLEEKGKRFYPREVASHPQRNTITLPVISQDSLSLLANAILSLLSAFHLLSTFHFDHIFVKFVLNLKFSSALCSRGKCRVKMLSNIPVAAVLGSATTYQLIPIRPPISDWDLMSCQHFIRLVII